MAHNKSTLDGQLTALDSALVMMRAKNPSREQLQAMFDAAAERIRAEAGPFQDYVTSRLLAIWLANRLGPT
jgi:hypothetical protein